MLLQDVTLPAGERRDIRIRGERIAEIEEEIVPEDSAEVIDCAGLRAMPGAIDVHVHFREPGFSYKESWASGSASAAAGGVTTVVDQPNTDPPTIDGASFDEKLALASASHVDFGINGGVTPEWDPESLFDRPLCALGEVFLADSTGEMGIAPDLFADAVHQAGTAGVPVTVHAEDASAFAESARSRSDPDAWSAYRCPEAEVQAIETVIDVAAETDTQLHIAHASTTEGIDAAVANGLTCEVSPHHLFLSRDDLEDLGTYGRMNPPLRSETIRAGLWDRLIDGTIDIVATDHAPHTAAEKEGDIWSAASGVPGVETMLPLLLAAAAREEISYERVAAITARDPAEIFHLDKKGRLAPGYDADIVLFDADEIRAVDPESLHTACGWTPFEGWDAVFPVRTYLRGQCIYAKGSFESPHGANVR